jgi:hypothetical protein
MLKLKFQINVKVQRAAFNSEVQHMSPKLHWAFGN